MEKFTDYATLNSSFASYNGLVVMTAFGTIFVIVLLILAKVPSRKKEVKDRFDIAYCGEEPNSSTHLHYGSSIGEELKRVSSLSLIYKNSVKPFYDYVATQTLSLAVLVKKIYSGNLSNNFNIAVVFVVILLWWSLK